MIIHFDWLLLLNGKGYRPGIGLEWKIFWKSLESLQLTNVFRLFWVCFVNKYKGASFFLIRVV